MSWAVIPKNLTQQLGWAHLVQGDFAKNAPNAPADHGDSDYFYTQTTVQF